MRQRSQFTIGNWAIGQHVRPHAMGAFSSVNRFALKVSEVKSLTTSSVGQAPKMMCQIRNIASATMFHVQHTGGLAHGNCARLPVGDTVNVMIKNKSIEGRM